MYAKRPLAALLFLAAAFAAFAAPSEAAFTNRFGATATLLPDGNILIVGGLETEGLKPLATAQLSLEAKGFIQDAASMAVARSSHTATLMANGEVLVAGGYDPTNGGALSSAEIYNPSLNCWRPAITMVNVNGRYNHTATQLKNGKVLICGGQQNGGTPMSSSCELFTPQTPAPSNCAAYGSGGFAATTGGLLVPRALHTASLLGDGRVFITGGMDTTGTSSNQYLVTSELYNPTNDTFGAAANLIEARAYHRASVMGNGKVLITGGFNNRDKLANRGFLDSSEIYDPVSDSMSPGGQMLGRVMQHSQVVHGDGLVGIFGGLGNITTTYADLTGVINSTWSTITGATPPLLSTHNITGGGIEVDVDIKLSKQVSGIIEDGFILYSTPSVVFPNGIAYLTPGKENSATGALSGTYSRLDGVPVYCKPDQGTCGHVTLKAFIPPAGQYFLTTPISVSGQINALAGGSIANWAGPIATNGTSQANLKYDSTFIGSLTIGGLPLAYVGAQISTAVIAVSGGGVAIQDQFTLSIAKGFATMTLPQTLVASSDGTSSEFTTTVRISSITQGTVSASTSTPVNGPYDVSGSALASVAGALKLTLSQVKLIDQNAFSVDIATFVIRKMQFSDYDRYDPLTNSWSFKNQGYSAFLPRFGAATVLTPSGDMRMFGGKTCLDTYLPPLLGPSCNSKIPADQVSVILKLNAFGLGSQKLTTPRGNMTSTLLPNGSILIAGGSNGPNVLPNAELFDPVTQTFARTGDMKEPRDLHTATLLPNGRVLVAGGFTTNATSTGSTSGAEIYYPDVGVWLKTSTMPYAANNHTATLLPNGNVLVVGGYSNGVYLDKAAIYVSTESRWMQLPSMPAANRRARHTATLLQDGRVFIAGGINDTGVLCSSVLYDPNNGWVAGPTTPSCSPLHSHSASMLKDGTVLLAGGNDGFGETDDSFIFTPAPAPAGGTMAATAASVGTKRFNHVAMALPSGIVMVAGGSQSLGNALAQVETFDVAASSWQLTGGLIKKRAGAAMSIGKDGFLYIFGGSNGVTMEDTYEALYFTAPPDANSLGVPSSVRQSQISSVDVTPFKEGAHVTVRGSNLLGVGEAAGGGAASGNASFHNPRLLLQSVASGGAGSMDGGVFTLDLSTRIYSRAATDPNQWTKLDSSVTVQMPSGTAVPNAGLGGMMLPYGWYHLRTYTNSVYSDSLLVQAGPAKPAGTPGAVSATVLGISSINWTWSAGTLTGGTYDGYALYSSSSGILIATTSVAQTSYIQRNLSPNTTGSIIVAGFSLTGDGPLARSSTFWTFADTPTLTAASFSNVGFNSLDLQWGTAGNTPGTIYEVGVSSDNFVLDYSTPIPQLVNFTASSTTITFLQPNTTYYFRVRAFNGLGTPSSYSVSVATRTRAPVGGLTGTPVNSTTIAWNWVDPGGVSYFNVYNSTTGVLIASTGTATYFDVNLATNSQRSVMVSAVTSAGEGPLSASASAYTLAAVPGGVTLPIINITTGSFTAVWTANGNPLHTVFDVQLLDDAGNVDTERNTENFSESFGGFTQAGAAFNVQVRSLNGDGVPSAFLVLGTSSTLAVAPTSLTVNGTTSNSITVSWSGGVNSSSVTYEVQLTTDNFTTIQRPKPFSAKFNGNSLLIDNLLTSTTYSIRVQGQNIFGAKTAFSNIVTTSPFNGGVALGSLGGPVSHTVETIISGTVGGSRSVELRIPPNAFPADTFITISTFTTPPSPCSGGLPVGISITPNPLIQPVKPVYFSFAYTAADLGGNAVNKVALERVDVSGRCVPLLTTADTGAGALTAQLNHFSQFQLAAITPTSTTESASIFPNPFYPSRGNGFVTFAQMPSSTRVRVFTLRGELIWEGTSNAAGLLTWGGVNRAGRSVASGVYLAVLEAGGQKSVYKVVVLR